MRIARATSDITMITPAFAVTALAAATAWSVAIILVCVDAAGVDLPHPLIFFVCVAAGTVTVLAGQIRVECRLSRHAVAAEWSAYAEGLEDGGVVHKWLQ